MADMRLTLKADGSREDIAQSLTTLAAKLATGQESGVLRDANGNRLGAWFAVDWTDVDSILRYAAEAEVTYLKREDIVVDGDELTIDGMDPAEWFDEVFGD